MPLAADKIKKLIPGKEKRSWRKTFLIIFGIVFVVAVLFFSFALAYAQFYKNRIYPGIYIGKYHIGGMTTTELKEFIENFNNRIAKEGLVFSYYKDGKLDHLKLSVMSADDSSVELIKLDSDKAAQDALAAGRSKSFFKNLWQPVYFSFFSSQSISARVVIENKFADVLKNSLSSLVDKPRDANVKIFSFAPLSYEVIPEAKGGIFDNVKTESDIRANLSVLYLAPIALQKTEFMPKIVSADINAILTKLPAIFDYGNLNLNYIDSQSNQRTDWNITPAVYAGWIEARKIDNGDIIFALNKEKVQAYLATTISPFIDRSAQNAKFIIAGDKVQEFQGNQSGLKLNTEETYNDLDAVFRDRNYSPGEFARTVTVAVDMVEPDIKVPEVNNLGIADVLGAGISTFKDSHTNRIKNIANAVKRLNGILIKPDEEFSANKYAGPYTTENGFLPEQVIKGNRIKPEVGGGMCQIGTTLFRMAMNAGMPITERRNHSLVINYYADPINGNPGTDATLYEPIVDFKFINDTGNYLLLQANIDYKKQQLTFTLWGRSDGRKGWYTHPLVSRWIFAGEPQEIKVDDGSLKPGEKNCQNAFRGAVASFTYTRVTSSSEKIDRVFESYYRPLPKICLVGVEPGSLTPPADASTTLPMETP